MFPRFLGCAGRDDLRFDSRFQRAVAIGAHGPIERASGAETEQTPTGAISAREILSSPGQQILRFILSTGFESS
jgi:hypothetical protein